jgi:ferric-dicitrate binding protein FerR (iron transport regulator)
MQNEFVILLEKFFQKQAAAEDTERLIALFNQPETLRIFSKLYREKWNNADFHADTEAERRIWARLESIIKTSAVPVGERWWKKYAHVAAAAILIPMFTVGLWLAINPYSQGNSQNMCINVDMGQKANMTLPDGTQVWLNSASTLSYSNSYNKKDRTIYLQGEAFFKVSKDEKRPFKVMADEVTIEALGTSFNVKAYLEDNQISTTLIEGNVQVSDDKEVYILHPNEKIMFSKQSHLFAKTTLMDAERSSSWRNNELAFEQETLEEIAKALERMYNAKIIFASEDLKKIRFSGKVKNNNLESTLQLISLVSPILHSVENSTVIIKENPKEMHLYKSNLKK